ncbi:MAG TPA: hypothetical protein VGA69_01790 [Nitriliruptorales bacterium]
MSATPTSPTPPLDADVQAHVEGRVLAAREHLGATIERRRAAYERLRRSKDPDDQAVAAVYRNYLIQAEEVSTSGASLTVAAAHGGEPVVGRLAVFDPQRDVILVSWHSPEGQRQLLADDRLLVNEHPDGSLTLHTLQADDRELADRVRRQMRTAAAQERMSDPLATLTREQGQILASIVRAPGDVVLHGPPGSGKSAIVMVELARRVLSAEHPEHFDALFVTGTSRLAGRAAALGRLLGTASITPVTQEEVLSFLGVTDLPTPQADAAGATGSMALPLAIEAAFARLQGRLGQDVEVPHPLGGTISSGELGAVASARARAASVSYRDSARALAAGLRDEFTAILPGQRSQAVAAEAARLLRPYVTPTDLVELASVGRTLPLPRPLRAAATAGARSLLEAPGGRRSPTWDLIVVDEYQRLPGVVRWLLQRQAQRLLLSGDPRQSFAAVDAVDDLGGATCLSLRTSLRVPDALAGWIDRWWTERDLEPPRIRSAAGGGRVRELTAIGGIDAGQVIAPASVARRHDGWLDPTEAVGLEWSIVVLADPDAILDEHGPAGIFIAATRAIDELHVVRP